MFQPNFTYFYINILPLNCIFLYIYFWIFSLYYIDTYRKKNIQMNQILTQIDQNTHYKYLKTSKSHYHVIVNKLDLETLRFLYEFKRKRTKLLIIIC